MPQRNRFLIRNEFFERLLLNLEPEGILFPLRRGEEVVVEELYINSPVTFKLSTSDTGEPLLSLWPGDGEVTVRKDGINVLELAAGPLSAERATEVA